MPDGNSATPATLTTLLQTIEDLINRGESAEALGVLAKAKPLANRYGLGDNACAVLLDGEAPAVPLVKDLHRAGFALQSDEHGVLWLKRVEEEGPPPCTLGLNTAELLGQLAKELKDAQIDINGADTLVNVAAMALHHQDCDRDEDIAHVLESRVWPDLDKARDAVASAQGIVQRLAQLTAEVSHG